MAHSDSVTQLKTILAEKSGTRAQDWYPVFKARYGMRAVFDALRAVRGDGAVLTQLFTCCTAVDPITAAGLRPVYADVDADTLAIDSRLLLEGRPVENLTTTTAESSWKPKDYGQIPPIRAVVLQHTFGIFNPAADVELAERTRHLGALLMEDNAHAVTLIARGRNAEPLVDVSVHSFGVDKILSATRFGGALWVNPSLAARDAELDHAIRVALSALDKPDPRVGLAARMYLTQIRAFARLPRSISLALRKGLQKVRLFEPPTTEAEQQGKLEYPNLAITDWVARTAMEHLTRIDANLAHRSRIVQIYREELVNAPGITIPASALKGEPQPLLLFPLLLKNETEANAARSASRENAVRAVRWYNTILFPGSMDDEAYFVPEEQGIAGELTHRSLGLPTDVSPAAARSAAKAIVARVAKLGGVSR